jgi:HK97 family phage major capsid protein
MPPTLDELREQRNDAATKADEIAKRDDVTQAELDQADELLTTVENLDQRIKVLEKNDAVQARQKEPRPDPDLGLGAAKEDRSQAAYDKAFRKFLRGGTRNLNPREFETLQTGFTDLSGEARALGTATGGAGGYTIPADFQRRITETMVAFGGMRQVANVITTDTGATLPWPGNNDTANLGAILDENTAMSELDVAFTTNSLGAFMYVSGMVRVSYQLLQDTFFDLEAFLARKLGQRIGRIQNRHFTIGVDTTQPQGLVVGGTSGVTAASATAVTFPELMALKQSVNSAYRDGGNAKWMMNDTTYGEVSGLLDTTGRPLLQPDLTDGGAGRLLGYPIVINPDMPHTATGLKPIAFGDFNAGYVIRDVRGIQITRLDERYAEYLQVAFFAYARADGGVDDAAAYRLITMA